MNIELDITRECNFRCPSCNRFCNIYPKNPKSIMTLSEINAIINELNNYDVDLLKIIGGEPTIHPQFEQICSYINKHSSAKRKLVYTNGSNNQTIRFIHKYFKNILVYSQATTSNEFAIKKNKNDTHINAYQLPMHKKCEYDKCLHLAKCGINIFKYDNKIFYTYSASCSFISRLLMKDDMFLFSTLNELLNSDKSLLFQTLCPYCAFFTTDFDYSQKKRDFNIIDDIFKSGYNAILTSKDKYLNDIS